ncbi:MAG TPA: rhodanese-like domain-containing protein [Psychromonas hadalis]|nr:rhodanese-like domain-containing protein [Psychromonas hadalis]
MAITGRELVNQLRSQVDEIDVHQLKEVMENDPLAIVIDIRERAEMAQGVVENTALIPRGILEMQIDSNELIQSRFATLDELVEQPLYLLCRTGTRSVFSALTLKMMGFREVYSIAGGVNEWVEAGYELKIE